MKWTHGDERLVALRERFLQARKSPDRWSAFVETLTDGQEMSVAVEWALYSPDIMMRHIRSHASNLGSIVELAISEDCYVTISIDRHAHVIDANMSYEKWHGFSRHAYLACVAARRAEPGIRHNCRAWALCEAALDLWSPTAEEIDAEAVEEDDQSQVEAVRAAHPEATIGHMRWQWPDGTVMLDTPVAWLGPVQEPEQGS